MKIVNQPYSFSGRTFYSPRLVFESTGRILKEGCEALALMIDLVNKDGEVVGVSDLRPEPVVFDDGGICYSDQSSSRGWICGFIDDTSDQSKPLRMEEKQELAEFYISLWKLYLQQSEKP